jgi:uridylate kinase
MKKTIVISLGGSIIIPNQVNIEFLKEFKKIILKNRKNYKFIIVCGGGKTARNYIQGLENESIKKKEYFQCLLGVSATRLNARFMTYFFGNTVNKGLPSDMIGVKNLLRHNDIIFCGALRYGDEETSDSTSAKLARFFNCDFINLTNISGLYSKDPTKFKDASFIREISSKDFFIISKKIGFKPGQHFVLDRTAAKIIYKNKIKTYILGSDAKNLDNLLNDKEFKGTIIL